MMLVVHVAPKFPPAMCGLGDYATSVGGQMECDNRLIRSGYLCCNTRNKLSPGAEVRNVIAAIAERTAEAFWKSIGELSENHKNPELAIVLHYSGYGYSQDGAPEWLARAFEGRPQKFQNCQFITFFHELYARGKPWNRSFWYSDRQKSVASRIANESDAVLTNMTDKAVWLSGNSRHSIDRISVIPVPSNVGEPVNVPLQEERNAWAVVFGSVGKRAKSYAGCLEFLLTNREQFQIDEIIDVGPGSALPYKVLKKQGMKFTEWGALEASEVSKVLTRSRVGLAFANGLSFQKSGILAAYAAHGVVPVVYDNDCRRVASPLTECGDCEWILSDSLKQSSYFQLRSVKIHAAAIDRAIFCNENM